MPAPVMYAMVHIEKQFVANVVYWDGTTAESKPPAGYEMVSAEGKFVGVGFLVEGGEFVPPPGMLPGDNYPA